MPGLILGRPLDWPVHEIRPCVGASVREFGQGKPRLRRREDSCIRIGRFGCFADTRLQAGIFLQNSSNMVALHANARPPATRTLQWLMVPFDKLEQNDPERGFQSEVQFLAHVIELLGDVGDVGFIDTTRAQQGSLLHRPTVQINIVARPLAGHWASFVARRCRSIVHLQPRGSYGPNVCRSYGPNISRLTISRMISLVPSRIWCTRKSRSTRSIGWSRR